MKKHVLMAGAFMGLLAVTGARIASAQAPTLFQIIHSYDPNAHLVNGNGLEGSFLAPSPNISNITVQNIYAGSKMKNTELTGYYNIEQGATGPVSKHYVAYNTVQHSAFAFHGAPKFGLFMIQGPYSGFIIHGPGNGAHLDGKPIPSSPFHHAFTWYTQTFRNKHDVALNGTYSSGPAKGLDSGVHALTFRDANNGTIFVAFEDQFFNGEKIGNHPRSNISDGNFTDAIFRMKGARMAPVPEPAFLQLGTLLSGGGLMAFGAKLRRRRK